MQFGRTCVRAYVRMLHPLSALCVWVYTLYLYIAPVTHAIGEGKCHNGMVINLFGLVASLCFPCSRIYLSDHLHYLRPFEGTVHERRKNVSLWHSILSIQGRAA